MKTILHLALNDEDRNKLACLLDNKVTKRLVSRNEVTIMVQEFIKEMVDGHIEKDEIQSPAGRPAPVGPPVEEPDEEAIDPATLRKACKEVLEHLGGDPEWLNLGWCSSKLLATGIR